MEQFALGVQVNEAGDDEGGNVEARFDNQGVCLLAGEEVVAVGAVAKSAAEGVLIWSETSGQRLTKEREGGVH